MSLFKNFEKNYNTKLSFQESCILDRCLISLEMTKELPVMRNRLPVLLPNMDTNEHNRAVSCGKRLGVQGGELTV